MCLQHLQVQRDWQTSAILIKIYLREEKRQYTDSLIMRLVLEDCDIYFPKFLKNTGLR